MSLAAALLKLADGSVHEQVELAIKSRSGRILHLHGGRGDAPHLPIADVVKGTHPAATAAESVFRHGGYRMPQDALKFEGTEDRGGIKVHRFSAHAKAGRQTGKPLSELLWLAANSG
jgi:hypothetical protein